MLELEEVVRRQAKKVRAARASAMRSCADLIQATFPGAAEVAAALREQAAAAEWADAKL